MRIAVVSDVHANLTAFEAVLADLRETAPDLILHGGDLTHGGSSGAEVVDRVRDLGWPGVVGNTDELLFRPASLDEFAGRSPAIAPFLPIIRDLAGPEREDLGADRLSWLEQLPPRQIYPPVALVHASPGDPWRAPAPEASDADLERVYGPLGQPVAVYGHIHRSFVRPVAGMTVVNAGSVSLSYDGDPRAAYLVLDDSRPAIRRVPYDIEKECAILAERRVPHAAWLAKTLRTGRFQMP